MKRSKKAWVILGIVAAIGLSAIGAFAYWTTTGSGTGSASVATANGVLVLHGTAPTDLYPGGQSEVTFTADNAGATNLFVGTIHLDSVAADAGHVTCDTADFSMADVVSNTMVPATTSGHALTGTGTLVYANTAVNQDGCKGADLTLTLSSN
jgi:hypothetical protein